MGEVSAKLFVLADAFTKSAREKIEAAGGTAQVIEIPSEPLAALGVEARPRRPPPSPPAKAPKARQGVQGRAADEARPPWRPPRPRPRPRSTGADVAEAAADEADAPADNG